MARNTATTATVSPITSAPARKPAKPSAPKLLTPEQAKQAKDEIKASYNDQIESLRKERDGKLADIDARTDLAAVRSELDAVRDRYFALRAMLPETRKSLADYDRTSVDAVRAAFALTARSKREIRSMTALDEQTVDGIVAALVRDGHAVKVGGGRATAYQAC